MRDVGAHVTVREQAGCYELLYGDAVIAHHPRLGRHQVAMERSYSARRRPRDRATIQPIPPVGDVSVRD